MSESAKKGAGRAKLSAYEQGVRLLASRDHAVAELRRKLVQRRYGRAEIDDALDRLVEHGYLDDERTAKLWAEQEARRSGQGRLKALNRMLEHGLPRSLAEAALDEHWDRSLEWEHARETLDRLAASIPPGERSSMATRTRLARRLSSRGFDSELVRELLRDGGGTESEPL